MAADDTDLHNRLVEWMRINDHQLEQDSAFYEALGRAIGAWSRIEGALFGMFLAVLKLPHADPAAAAFHAIVSFQGRLRMVDSAAMFALRDSPNFARWTKLEERIRKYEGRRNQCAHFMPRRYYDKEEGPQLYLAPHPYDANRAQKLPPKIVESDLQRLAEDFRKLGQELTIFAMELLGSLSTDELTVQKMPSPEIGPRQQRNPESSRTRKRPAPN